MARNVQDNRELLRALLKEGVEFRTHRTCLLSRHRDEQLVTEFVAKPLELVGHRGLSDTKPFRSPSHCLRPELERDQKVKEEHKR